MLLPFSIVLEDIEGVLRLNLIIESDLVCDLVFLLDQVQLFLNRRVVLVPILPDLEQHLDHILYSLIDVGFVKDIPELVKHRQGNRTAHLLQMLTHLSSQADGDFNTVVCGLVKQQQKDLRGQHLVRDLLVAQMGNERRGRYADCLVVSLECLSELDNETVEQQLADLGQFCVDNSRHRSVDRCEGQTGRLGFHDTSAKQTATAHQVLAKELRDDELDVGNVDLVDETVDRLLERLPRHPLVLLAGLVRDLCLQRP